MGLELRERVDRERGPQILDTSEVSLGPPMSVTFPKSASVSPRPGMTNRALTSSPRSDP
jgi:hypothetical protein